MMGYPNPLTITFTRHDGKLAYIASITENHGPMCFMFADENFAVDISAETIIGSRGLEVYLPDPDYAGYGEVTLSIKGACVLDAVQIKPLLPPNTHVRRRNETLITGADLKDVSVDGMATLNKCSMTYVSVKQPRELKRSMEPVMVHEGVRANNSYIKHHVGFGTKLGNNVNVSAPIGQNLIIPDNRAVYKPIDGAAAPTVVDDDLLEMLDALKDTEGAL